MLLCVLVLVAVLVSSLCATGQSAAESVRAKPASAAADARPAAGPLVGKAAAEQGNTDVREAVALHGEAGPSSSETGHCGKQAVSDTASARDGARPSAPLPTPEREEQRVPAAQAGPGPASRGPGSAPPAPHLLSVLRI
ncbi:hypothetical protein GCM10010271_46760 [Streptomyces kurssanovii]|nr:hypothetical protein GCM10010271_46760 [Streptomyces kurssanovii]